MANAASQRARVLFYGLAAPRRTRRALQGQVTADEPVALRCEEPLLAGQVSKLPRFALGEGIEVVAPRRRLEERPQHAAGDVFRLVKLGGGQGPCV
jgi:hypothetical protein